MQSKVASFLRLARSLGEQRRIPERFRLCLRLAGWALMLRLLHPLLPVRWLTRLALPGPVEAQLRSTDVIAGLRWLHVNGLLSPNGLCLPRALVCARFLALAGLKPTLLVGFDGVHGHAWVELGGKAFLETEAGVKTYRPILKARPGKRALEKV